MTASSRFVVFLSALAAVAFDDQANGESSSSATCECPPFNWLDRLDALAIEKDPAVTDACDGHPQHAFFQRVGERDETLKDARIKYRYCSRDLVQSFDCAKCTEGDLSCSKCGFDGDGNTESAASPAYTYSGGAVTAADRQRCTEYVTKTLYDDENTRAFLCQTGSGYPPSYDAPPYEPCGYWVSSGEKRPMCDVHYTDYELKKWAIAYASQGTVCISGRGGKCDAACYGLDDGTLGKTFRQSIYDHWRDGDESGGVEGSQEGMWIEITFLRPDDGDGGSNGDSDGIAFLRPDDGNSDHDMSSIIGSSIAGSASNRSGSEGSVDASGQTAMSSSSATIVMDGSVIFVAVIAAFFC